ncbi:MAG: PSD1 and planctomycete cytochrome C domain-containing protein [Limisphaerales bacterium]
MINRGWLGLTLLVLVAGPVLRASEVQFSRDVRPLLADNCFPCHGPDTTKIKGGLRLDRREDAIRPAKSGTPAIVPGRPDESELIRRILTADPDDLMPPPESHKSLTDAQKERLRRWVTDGAEYQGHWAYERPVKVPVPADANAIDHLVQVRLRELGLASSPEADRRTLMRRLYSDLVGLPPGPEEVAAFEQDEAPDAYPRLVERLLASPHFGERMAIGWLDAVRFADTIGYHSDNPRNIWPYRDYVIRAFNRNKPFDQFTREQLAGDLLPGAGQEQKVASGFNRLLLTTEEGGAQPKDYEARYLTDRVRAVGSVWLGQTIGCAQCHDHKFDPITARDFYSLGAFFADVKEPIIGKREDGMLVPDEAQARELARLGAEAARLEADFDGPHPELAPAFAQWELAQQDALANDAAWTRLSPAKVESVGGAELKVREDQSVLVTGKKPDKDTYTLRFTNELAAVVGLRLEALPDDTLPSKGPGRAGNGNFVLGEVLARIEREGAEPKRLGFRAAQATHEQNSHIEGNPYRLWSAASAIDQDVKGENAGWAILPQAGQAQQLLLELEEPLALSSSETLVIELRQNHGHEHHTLGCFRLAATSLADAVNSPASLPPPQEIATVLRVPADQRDANQGAQLFAHFKATSAELAPLRQALAGAKQALAAFEAALPRSLVTERLDPPRPVRILPRGNFLLETGELVEPAFPAFLARSEAAAESRRLNRLDLAEWLLAPDHPLTARVVVNRFWKQFFGIGLSKVLDDFGAQGEPPPNPALLDWLAREFIDRGWDVKHLVRLMVTSQTYRQSSTVPRDALARDPDNRELARQGRWRVEAELVRDGALSFAGLLVPTIGGPSVRPYQPEGYWENLNFPPRTYESSAGPGQYRRGLYVWWQRSFPHPSLLAFDAPTREECAVERSRSNIPQQALVLLNDPTYVEAARHFAARILGEATGSDDARITWAWRQALSRAPRAGEIAVVQALLDKHRAEYRRDPAAATAYLQVGATPPAGGHDPAELAAWTNVARTLLNLHETITRS